MKKRIVISSLLCIFAILILCAFTFHANAQNSFFKNLLKSSEMTKVTETDFDDALKITVEKDVQAFEKSLKITDFDGDEILYLVNFIDDKTLAIAPLTKMGKVSVKADVPFKIEAFTGTFYIDNHQNVKKIERYLDLNRRRYPPVYTFERDMNTMTDAKSDAPTGAAKAAAPSAEMKSDSGEFSKTNVQEKDIDEGDIIKTDGKYIYYVNANVVHIISAQGTKSEKLSEIKIENTSIKDILLHKDMLIVFANEYSRNSKASILIYSTKNKKSPTLLHKRETLGGVMQTRLFKDHVYIQSSYYIPIHYKRGFFSGEKAYLNTEGIDLKKLIFIPANTTQDVTIIDAINLNDFAKSSQNSILTSAHTLYMSQNNLYLAYQDYSDNYGFGRWNYEEKTVIRKFSIEAQNITHAGSATIEGHLLNQFSLGEKDGHLLVAYHSSMKNANFVTTFDKDLKSVSTLGDIAKDERIYSTRFVGDKLYMVTFKQVDPLFVIDIADMRAPKILGYLKIPGFSDYLHPYKDGLLIGFGQDTRGDMSARIDGFKLSLFDVRNFEKPKEIQSIVLGKGHSSSVVNDDHRALMTFEKENLIGFPVSIIDERKLPNRDYQDYYVSFQGAIMYDVTERGFKELFRVTHKDKNSNKKEDYDNGPEYKQRVKRVLYINGTVYTLSPDKAIATDVKTKKELARVKLEKY